MTYNSGNLLTCTQEMNIPSKISNKQNKTLEDKSRLSYLI